MIFMAWIRNRRDNMKRKKIFSGDYSVDMWDAINNAKNVSQLREALYFVCCRLQELESDIDKEG